MQSKRHEADSQDRASRAGQAVYGEAALWAAENESKLTCLLDIQKLLRLSANLASTSDFAFRPRSCTFRAAINMASEFRCFVVV